MARYALRDSTSRRRLLAAAGKLVTLSGAVSLLAACGGAQATAPSPSGPAATAAPTTAAAGAAPTTAAAGAPAATAPAAAASKATGEVVFWYPTQTLGDMLVKEYTKAHSDIKPQFVLGEYDSNTKTMAALAAGTPPDLSYLGRWQGPDLAVRNAIFALDNRIKQAQSWTWSDVWPRLQKDAVQWGKTWVVPYSTDTRAFFYNKTLMQKAGLDPEKPPTTWQDMAAQAIKGTTKDSAGKIDTIGFTPTFGNPPTFLLFYSLLWILGSDVVNEDHTKVILQDKGAEAMKLIKDLMDQQGGYEQASAFTKSLTLGTGLDAFSVGKVM